MDPSPVRLVSRGHRQAQREDRVGEVTERHVNTEVSNDPLQAKESRRLSEVQRETSETAWLCQHLDFGLVDFVPVRQKFSVVLSHPVGGTLYGGPWKGIQIKDGEGEEGDAWEGRG